RPQPAPGSAGGICEGSCRRRRDVSGERGHAVTMPAPSCELRNNLRADHGPNTQIADTLIVVCPRAVPGFKKLTFQLVLPRGSDAVRPRFGPFASSNPPPTITLLNGHCAVAGTLVTNAPIAG